MPGRVFAAIELHARARELTAEATEAFRSADPSWAGEKFVPPRLLHVTLAFLGDLPDPALPALLSGLAEAGERHAPLGLRLGSLRCVPSGRRAAMVWLAVEGETAAAAALADAALAAAGMEPDPRGFRPHVTLARARRPRPVAPEAVRAFDAVVSAPGREADRTVSVRAVTVFSSTLGATGPTYERLAAIPLGGGASRPRSD